MQIFTISPSTFDDGKPVTLTGSGFGASQGQVLIGGVAQNVNTWSDDEITFTTVRGSQSLGACRVDVVKGSADWQLASGHWVAAKMAPQIIYPRPDASTPSYARHRNLYPSLAYRIPVVVQGGAWPFRYELTANTNLPGVAIGSTLTVSGGVQVVGPDYGVIHGTAPASGGPYTVEVKVTDQDGTQITRSWSVAVGTSAFVFYDSADTGSLNTGTIDEPYKDFAALAGTDYTVANNYDKIVYVRGGSHTLVGFANSGNNYRLTGANKPRSFVAYPGESVTMSLNGDGHHVMEVSDCFFGGITYDGNPDKGANYSYQFRSLASQSRCTWFECTFTGYAVRSANTGDNPTHMYIAGGSYQHMAWVRCVWTGDLTNGITIYDTTDSVFELNTLTSPGTLYGSGQNDHGFWYLKDGGTNTPGLTLNFTIRGNTQPATLGTFQSGIGVNDQGGMQYVEVCYNRVAKGTSYSYKSPSDGAGSLNRVWVYRNSMEGGRGGVTSTGLTDLLAEYNVQNSGSWSVYSSSNNQIATGNLNSSLDLTGTARTNYLGTHGAEVA